MVSSTMKATIGTYLVISVAVAVEVTPFEKVIKLLEGLSSTLAEEGKKEASSYDKYACFCKEQSDQKLNAIEKSQKKTQVLNAEIEALDTAIAFLNGKNGIAGLKKRIAQLESDISAGMQTREKEHNEYLAKAQDMNEAITSAANAADSVKDAKLSLKGAKIDLVQVRHLQALVSRQPILTKSSTGLMDIGQQPAAYEFASNEILATVKSIKQTFLELKMELDSTEKDEQFKWDHKELGLSNEKSFLEKDLGQKESVVEAKTEQMQEARSAKDEETKDMNADEAFLTEVTQECESKAKLFDQRSSTRSAELSAITEALQTLKDGDVSKMLAGSQKAELTELKLSRSRVRVKSSFIQIRSVRHHYLKRKAAAHQAQELIVKMADKTQSSELSLLATKMKILPDNFNKVRGLIKDLLSKLQADAISEARQKSFCDTGMAEAVSNRDAAMVKIEAASAKVTKHTATKNNLLKEIADLHDSIAKLMKAMNEATVIRYENKAENAEIVSKAKESIAAVTSAISILQQFYQSSTFAQTDASYVPKNADRSGKAANDLAPKTFTDVYHGKFEEAKGIFGVLEVLLSDLKRSQRNADLDEADQQEDFKTFTKDIQDDAAKFRDHIAVDENVLAETDTELLSQQQSLMDAKEFLASAEDVLTNLKLFCMEKTPYGLGRKHRMDNIDALKEAMSILE